MDNQEDLVVFTDDDGHELTLEILDYFFYNGQEYAVLTDAISQVDNEAGDEEDEDDQSLYIMQVVPVDDEMEEFIPVDDEIMDNLVEIVMTRFDAEDGALDEGNA